MSSMHPRVSSLALLILLLLCSCSSADDSDTSREKSDPVGTFSVAIDVPETLSGACAFLSVAQVSAVKPPDLPAPDGSVADLGELGKDDDISVKCAVSGDEEKSISISIEGPNFDPQNVLLMGQAALSVVGQTDELGEGDASVVARNAATGNMESFGEPCQLHVLPVDDSETLAFSFTCPEASTERDQFGVCSMRGTVVVQNCNHGRN